MKNALIAIYAIFPAATCLAASASLVHRWSFNGTYTDSVTGAAPANRWGTCDDGSTAPLEITPGKVVFSGSGRWGGGSLSLGVGSLGSADATVEIWASNDEIVKNSILFAYSDQSWGATPQNEVCFQWSKGTDAVTDGMWLKSGGTDKLKLYGTLSPFTLGREYYFAFTFHDNGDGSSTVRWQRRDATTGALEKSQERTVSGWTLANVTASSNPTLAIGVYKNNAAGDAKASYNEVRVWDGVLSDAQLEEHAAAGADVIPDSAFVIPAGESRTMTYIGWDPVVLLTTRFQVEGTAAFNDVGGFYLNKLCVGPSGKITYDPTKFTFRLCSPPSFASGAKVALAPKYAANEKGRFLLMTWDAGQLEMDDAALTAVFDASSARGARPKVWAENLEGGGGRLWLDLDDGAPKQRVNVLCVGDSITHGNDGKELCGTGKNGGWGNWRTGLMKKLAAAGYEPVAKGHRWEESHDICGATMPDEWISHAGAGGQRLYRGTFDQIENTLDQAGDVDFVLCKIGTNDMGGMQPAALFQIWSNLVWKVLDQKPAAKFIAGAVVDIAYDPSRNTRVVAYNALVSNAVANAVFPAKRVYFADLYTPCYRYDANGNEIPGAFYDDSVNILHPDWPNNDKIADVYCAAIRRALADDPSFATGAAETGLPTTSGAEANVPAAYRSGYTRARVFDVAANNGVNLAALGRVPYADIGETGAAVQDIGRVGYYIELKRKDDALSQYHGLVRWLWVSMDAFGDRTIETAGVPLDNAKRYQEAVANLRVASNMPGIHTTTADAVGIGGWLEFWPSAYSSGDCGAEGAPGSTHGYDWNDTCSGGPSGYGSMQVHRLTPGEANPAQVLFAFNRWTVVGNYEIGIGNFSHKSLGSVDWTFAAEKLGGSQRMTAAAYEAARIEVWTMPKAVAATAIWTGGGSSGDATSPLNWRCTDQDGNTIAGALPSATTAVVFDGGVLKPTSDTTGTYATAFIRDFSDFTIGANGMTIETIGKNLGMKGCTLKIVPGGKLRITGGGAFSFSDTRLCLTGRPCGDCVLAETDGTFSGMPAFDDTHANGGKLKKSADGKRIYVDLPGLTLVIK